MALPTRPLPIESPRHNETTAAHRVICARCRRPASACFCPQLPSLTPRTHVVFLQHPRERRVAISTCRMAHLALSGSELHHGVRFDGHPVVEALLAAARTDGGVALLFPAGRTGTGKDVLDPAALPPGFVHTLIVVDGTWPQAKKLIAQNPLLQQLPRIGLAPAQPSNYRIRREPEAHCVSTIESVVEILGLLEGDPERFRSALSAFTLMVDIQIARQAARVGPPRPRRRRTKEPRPPLIPALLQTGSANAVAIYTEANPGPPRGSSDGRAHAHAPAHAPELVHLLAVRIATGERFESIVRPRRALGPATAFQLELPEERFVDGEPFPTALARFFAFVQPDDFFCGWGRFGIDLLIAEAREARESLVTTAADVTARSFVDLRTAALRHLKRKPGGIEQAALLLGQAVPNTWTAGRGGRRIAALEAVLIALCPKAPS